MATSKDTNRNKQNEGCDDRVEEEREGSESKSDANNRPRVSDKAVDEGTPMPNQQNSNRIFSEVSKGCDDTVEEGKFADISKGDVT